MTSKKYHIDVIRGIGLYGCGHKRTTQARFPKVALRRMQEAWNQLQTRVQDNCVIITNNNQLEEFKCHLGRMIAMLPFFCIVRLS